MRIRVIVLSALLFAVAAPVMAQQQPEIYPLSDNGTPGQPVSPQVQQPVRTVHHYPVYSQNQPRQQYAQQPQQQVQDDQQQDDQQDQPPPPPRRSATRGPSRAIQVQSVGHRLWQIVLVPRDESVSSDSAIVIAKVPGRDECEKRIMAFYEALGAEDDRQEPDYTLSCQVVAS